MISALALCSVWSQTIAYVQTAPIKQDLPRGEKEEAVAEALIRQRVEEFAKAISVMSVYAPNIVSFEHQCPSVLHRGRT